ncbi:MAG TPA: response regulator transcription factor [Verrucomicrobiae bacterium]|jgi:two-component system KDP operon response regulator KdpE|nr:response regulator transcription factor [Verrucomicrobiae bacterium]
MGALRILIVDDERPIRRFLKATLASEGYRIFEAVDAQTALEASVSVRPDVIFLDLGLPDKDGVEVAKEIRSRSSIPIIILSVRDEEADKVAALYAGADDYLTKPFSNAELLARLHAVLRRWMPHSKNQVFKTGRLTVDIERRLVSVDDNPVHLSPTEYTVLKTLVMQAGKVVTHKTFFQEVWNKAEMAVKADHLLRVTISNLRSKIEPDPDRPVYILTEPLIGYRLSYKP